MLSKFRVSCIRVLAAVIVVYVFSCINKVLLFFRVCIFVYQYIFLFFLVYFVYFLWISVKEYFVLSAIYYIQSLKSQFRQQIFENKVNNWYYGPT